jgi:hypothetical protein
MRCLLRSSVTQQVFVIVGADALDVPFPQRFVYVVRVGALTGMEIMLEAHLFEDLSFGLVPFGDTKDRDGGNPEIFNSIETIFQLSRNVGLLKRWRMRRFATMAPFETP